MTAEVEAMLARLDKAGVSLVPSVLVVREAAALIRAQAEEIARLHSAFEQEHFHYGKVHEEYALCRKLLMERTADWQAAEDKLAAAARQEPVPASTSIPDTESCKHAECRNTGNCLDPLFCKATKTAPVPAGDLQKQVDEVMEVSKAALHAGPAGDAVSVPRNLHEDCAENGCHAFRVGFRKCDNGECHRK